MKNKQCMCLTTDNHRVIKWNKGAKEGIVVAGGEGDMEVLLTQLYYLNGLFVDMSGAIDVAESVE